MRPLAISIRPARPEDTAHLVDLIRTAFEEYDRLTPPSSAHTQTPERLAREMEGGALIAIRTVEPAGCVLYWAAS